MAASEPIAPKSGMTAKVANAAIVANAANGKNPPSKWYWSSNERVFYRGHTLGAPLRLVAAMFELRSARKQLQRLNNCEIDSDGRLIGNSHFIKNATSWSIGAWNTCVQAIRKLRAEMPELRAANVQQKAIENQQVEFRALKHMRNSYPDDTEWVFKLVPPELPELPETLTPDEIAWLLESPCLKPYVSTASDTVVEQFLRDSGVKYAAIARVLAPEDNARLMPGSNARALLAPADITVTWLRSNDEVDNWAVPICTLPLICTGMADCTCLTRTVNASFPRRFTKIERFCVLPTAGAAVAAAGAAVATAGAAVASAVTTSKHSSICEGSNGCTCRSSVYGDQCVADVAAVATMAVAAAAVAAVAAPGALP